MKQTTNTITILNVAVNREYCNLQFSVQLPFRRTITPALQKTSLSVSNFCYWMILPLLLTGLQSTARATGVPPCEDDECTIQKDYVMNSVIGALVDQRAIVSTSEISKIINKNQVINFTLDYGNTFGAKKPFWGIESVQALSNSFIRLNFDITEICIRRVDVEKTFIEPWKLGETPARYYMREAKPGTSHNGIMSFREAQEIRFSFGFKPSGCATTFLLSRS
jgi:hypothetical protein